MDNWQGPKTTEASKPKRVYGLLFLGIIMLLACLLGIVFLVFSYVDENAMNAGNDSSSLYKSVYLEYWLGSWLAVLGIPGVASVLLFAKNTRARLYINIVCSVLMWVVVALVVAYIIVNAVLYWGGTRIPLYIGVVLAFCVLPTCYSICIVMCRKRLPMKNGVQPPQQGPNSNNDADGDWSRNTSASNHAGFRDTTLRAEPRQQ